MQGEIYQKTKDFPENISSYFGSTTNRFPRKTRTISDDEMLRKKRLRFDRNYRSIEDLPDLWQLYLWHLWLQHISLLHKNQEAEGRCIAYLIAIIS